jgi:hypothetical protein
MNLQQRYKKNSANKIFLKKKFFFSRRAMRRQAAVGGSKIIRIFAAKTTALC